MINIAVMRDWLAIHGGVCVLAPDAGANAVVVANGVVESWGVNCGTQPTEAELDEFAVSAERVAYLLELRKSVLTADLGAEYMRRISLVNSHIGLQADGLEILESTLKAARDLAEKPCADLIAWIDTNTALSPPAALANIDAAEFIAILRVQPEFAAILDLRTAKNVIAGEIAALTVLADAEAFDVTAPAKWPA